jgi:pyrimidine-specific ribonucleoside hydrolase
MHRRTSAPLAALITAIAVVAVACSPSSEAETPRPTGEAAPEGQPVIIDTDVAPDDIAALLVMLRDPALDVRAITIAGTGVAHCQGGRLVVRHILDELERTDIPFGCGRVSAGPDARPFPEDWRGGADAGYGAARPRVETGIPLDAAELLVRAVDESPSAPTLVTLGPLTNVEDAMALDPSFPDRIAGIHAMLGTVDAPGNVVVDDLTPADPLEWNAIADPSAMSVVFDTEVPITLVPLDATDDVPMPADFADRLAEDHAAAGADILNEFIVRNPGRFDDPNVHLWDQTAALALTDPGLVTWEEANLAVGPRGELVRDDEAGRPVKFATAADAPAVEAALLDALRRGGPRATPFVKGGRLSVTWDGTSCDLATESATPGSYDLVFQGVSGPPSGVMIAGVQSPQTWADLEAFAETIDVSQEVTPPDWLMLAGQVSDDTGSGGLKAGLADLRAGTFGPVCYEGDWPDLRFVVGVPFEVSE